MQGRESDIISMLVGRGKDSLQQPVKFHKFTHNKEADDLLNDLKRFPHAYVIACIMDKQIKAERAWLIPFLLYQRLGTFDFSALEILTEGDVHRLVTKPTPLHRFPDKASTEIYGAIQRIKHDFNGNAALIWETEPSSAKVVYEFLKFRGAGPKIATMATNILARDFRIPFSDYYSIDVSVDVHIRRVLCRLGVIPKGASAIEIIYKVRALNPTFPGIIDPPLWAIGRNWCRPKKPQCDLCYMQEVCPKTGLE